MIRPIRFLSSVLLALTVGASAARAQSLTLPPSGDNQPASVIQRIGLVEVRIDYSSPDVHGPGGEDRKGRIWGQLVPYGLHDLGFNDCKECPWRAGANENTVFTVSHDIRVEGQPLAAGSYGLFMIVDPAEWTVIFSRNHTSWGAYWYDPAEDALRVKVKPRKAEYREWLTYDFTDRRPDKATVELRWEELAVPIAISVDDPNGLYVAKLREELRNRQGFEWRNWMEAAQFCASRKVNLAEGLTWAQNAVSKPGNGVENFQTLTTLSQLQAANGLEAESARTMERALASPTATPIDIHMAARSLQNAGKDQEAMKVFEANAKRFPKAWPTQLGLARGYAGLGDYRNAVAAGKRALAQAPDPENRKNVENLIAQWEAKAAAGR